MNERTGPIDALNLHSQGEECGYFEAVIRQPEGALPLRAFAGADLRVFTEDDETLWQGTLRPISVKHLSHRWPLRALFFPFRDARMAQVSVPRFGWSTWTPRSVGFDEWHRWLRFSPSLWATLRSQEAFRTVDAVTRCGACGMTFEH